MGVLPPHTQKPNEKTHHLHQKPIQKERAKSSCNQCHKLQPSIVHYPLHSERTTGHHPQEQMKIDELVEEINKHYNKCPYSLYGYLIGIFRALEILDPKIKKEIQFHINSFKKENQ
jgi:surfactin synthase thioesterase subunit